MPFVHFIEAIKRKRCDRCVLMQPNNVRWVMRGIAPSKRRNRNRSAAWGLTKDDEDELVRTVAAAAEKAAKE